MPSQSLLAAFLALAVGCQYPVRTRFATNDPPSPGSCRQLCALEADTAACMATCPGAIVESGQSCRQRRPSGACYERIENASSNGTIYAVGVVVLLAVAGGAAYVQATSDSGD